MANYAISDIHGNLDKFKKLLDVINFDPSKDSLYLLGDYVDCGPRSLDSLRYVMELDRKYENVHVLEGNHERHIILGEQPHIGRDREFYKLYEFECLDKLSQQDVLLYLDNIARKGFSGFATEINGQSFYLTHTFNETYIGPKGHYVQGHVLTENIKDEQTFIDVRTFEGSSFRNIDCAARYLSLNMLEERTALAALCLDDFSEFYVRNNPPCNSIDDAKALLLENPYNLVDIPPKFLTEEMIIDAINKDGRVLEYVPSSFISEEICNLAFSNNKDAIAFIPNEFITYNMCLDAIRENGYNLGFILEEFLTRELCEEAVSNNGNALRFVPDKFKDYDMCIKAVEQTSGALFFLQTEYDKNSFREYLNNNKEYCFIPKEFLNEEFLSHVNFANGREFDILAIPKEFRTEEMEQTLVDNLGYKDYFKIYNDFSDNLFENKVFEESWVEMIKAFKINYGEYTPRNLENLPIEEQINIRLLNWSDSSALGLVEDKTKEFYENIYKNFPNIIKNIPDEYKTKEMCNFCFKVDKAYLKYIPEEFITEEMIDSLANLRGVRLVSSLIKYIPEEFITEDFVLDFVGISSKILKRCTEEQLNNEDFMLQCIKINEDSFSCIGEKLQNDEFLLKAIDKNPRLFCNLKDEEVTNDVKSKIIQLIENTEFSRDFDDLSSLEIQDLKGIIKNINKEDFNSLIKNIEKDKIVEIENF